MACGGFSMGWTSPVTLKLTDANMTDTPLPRPITVAEEAWIGSVLSIGAIIGAIIAGPIAARIGRKSAIICATVPLLAGWVFVAASPTVYYIYVGRILWGTGIGMLFTAVPMYSAEIATNEWRGALGSYIQASITLGVLSMYSIGPYSSYLTVAYVGLAMLVAFNVIFFFMPETPFYHLTKNDRESAAKCLMALRGQTRAGVEAELDIMATDVAASMSKTATIADVFRGSNFKAFYISNALIFFQQFCGINAVNFYMNTIFEAAGANLDSSVASIIVGVVQMFASCVTPFVVDRWGRKALLLSSSCGTTIALACLGLFFLLKEQNSPVVDSIGFLPIASLMLFMASCCTGLGPVPWAVMSEVFPIEVKAVAAPICTAFCWILVFFVTGYFGPVSDALGMYVAFWIFGGCCVAAFFFVLFCLPETKGKSFSEIQEILAGKKSNGKA
ncbi:facilitated trehalose transporter Tret1-2 homolog [Cydia strobilella]|uniref:facilitated trehalose transporter Tret1-2 homolog n=1 Tax=Cydia strobilella TaxID=1100964 RepID=UPI003007E1D1